MASRLLYLSIRFAHFSCRHSRTRWNAYPRLAVTNTMRCPCGSLTDMWSGVCGGASHCSRIGKAFSRNQALRFASTSLQDVLALGCVAQMTVQLSGLVHYRLCLGGLLLQVKVRVCLRARRVQDPIPRNRNPTNLCMHTHCGCTCYSCLSSLTELRRSAIKSWIKKIACSTLSRKLHSMPRSHHQPHHQRSGPRRFDTSDAIKLKD